MDKDDEADTVKKKLDKAVVPDVAHTLEDIPRLVIEEDFYAAIEVIRIEGMHIKYSDVNKTRKRADLNELRNMAYTLQRDARSNGDDTSVIRDVIKGLNTGSSY